MSAPVRGRRANGPWLTGLVALAAVALHCWPRAGAALFYERARILDGEWWRLWTGHFVHFGASHLGWNLAVLLPAGAWAERLAPARTRVFLALAPLVIGIALLVLDPALARYAGLSGVVSGVLALLAFTQLAADGAARWFWHGVLALLALKIGVELFAGHAVFAHFDVPDVHAVPLAHAAGMVCAGAAHWIRRK